jgi:pSer/pThr/pTyr-binding forkhead associated (FHA) protein
LLTIEDGYVTVEDLDSINGTFINGQRLAGKQAVRPGDRLEIGPVEFVVDYDLTESARDRLTQQVNPVKAEDEEEEVLDVVGEDVEVLAEDATSEAPLAFADEDAADWHLPQTSDLRDLLSQVEKPSSDRRRRES